MSRFIQIITRIVSWILIFHIIIIVFIINIMVVIKIFF